MLRRLGIEHYVPEVPALTLGAGEYSPFDMATLYKTIASGGYRTPLKSIRTVLTAHGEIDDLRKAVVCNLKGRGALNADSMIMIRHWIGKDPLAKGLEPPRILVQSEDDWRYQETTPISPDWRNPNFDAGSWPTARGKIGCGEPDLDTTIRQGTRASACFRLELELGRNYDLPLHATIAHDDGGVVFVNGLEVYRGNLYPGPPHPDRPAAGIEPVEGQPHGFTIEPSAFDDGKGVIAIQIHQTREADRGNKPICGSGSCLQSLHQPWARC